ncbi:hypothetical protein D2V17_06380 [Aurantiacibacter xanthus]|uniref:Uncharacterized protein n=1 Tax=Aurantiacibacter xanthus TaxID=1784712 RepID=A0A3A1P605_9SPHN|nr:hypothetical protein [Aurantiacibacter xanthus]RIV89451.1 hypothetical protein D2V17_06380 [Aurantiacibacter xanthus]
MEGDRIAQAKARIEAAAARIEAAAGKLAGARQMGDPELEARYNALRAEAEEALAGLDMLITRLDPDNYEEPEASESPSE